MCYMMIQGWTFCGAGYAGTIRQRVGGCVAKVLHHDDVIMIHLCLALRNISAGERILRGDGLHAG